MSRYALLISVIVVLVAGNVQAAPLSVDIIDHDFTFDVPYYVCPLHGIILSAVYDYNGAAPDLLYLTSGAGWHNAASYSYAGNLPQVPPNPPGTTPPSVPPGAGSWLYPLFMTTQYGARLEIEMEFDTNDGPYVNPAGDTFDVSLTGKHGILRITGWIGTLGWPTGILYPDPQPGGQPNDIVLLEIEFDETTLLARAGHETADLIEGVGEIKTLLGWDMSDPAAGQLFPELDEMDGVTFFKFMLPDPNAALFPLPQGANYDPLEDYGWNSVNGGISGEAGLGVPEPMTLALLGLGGLALLKRRRRR